jgi:hypothetical protein
VVDATDLSRHGARGEALRLRVPAGDAVTDEGNVVAIDTVLVRPLILDAERATVAGAPQRRQDAVEIELALPQRRRLEVPPGTDGVLRWV